MLWTVNQVLLVIYCDVFVDENPRDLGHSVGFLLERFVRKPERPYFVEVYYHGHHTNLF